MENAALLSGKADDRNNRSPVSGCRSILLRATERKRRALGRKSADHPGTSGKTHCSRKRRKRTKVHPARRKAPRLLSEICHEQSCNGSKNRSKRRKLSRKDRCQYHLFQGNVQRPDRHLRSAEALERKEMDLGTLRTYRTPLPQGSSDPFTDTGP